MNIFVLMKKVTLSVLMLISLSGAAQTIDTVLNAGIYKSYINYQLRQPVYVSYILSKGGGDCSRAKFSFKNDTEINVHANSSYTRSGYDRGHLVNAEDFAYDCVSDEKTFRYYNCLPQTPNLNRGTWKVWETSIRNESQQDSLLIICGGKWSDTNQLFVNGMHIPDICWKVVYSLKSKQVLHALLFTNSETSTFKEMKLEELEVILGYKLNLSF